ncbi:hypothetical protein A3740_24290, partial [Oleiphilus sp. HI0068]
ELEIMPNIESSQNGQHYWLYDSECFSDISSELFESGYWKKLNAVNGQESGRGTTWFIQHKSHSLVLRHYLRGGMMSKISNDHYLFKGWQKSRSVSEFNILSLLNQQNLPVPKPAAAQVVKRGLYYQADLLTHRIPNAQDLLQVLKQVQSKDFYFTLGALIARFHKAGVYHADLNIQNILQDEEGLFWLIDFDRAKMLKPKHAWKSSNLKRLKRSFEKEVTRHGIKWTHNDWNYLIEGYSQ